MNLEKTDQVINQLTSLITAGVKQKDVRMKQIRKQADEFGESADNDEEQETNTKLHHPMHEESYVDLPVVDLARPVIEKSGDGNLAGYSFNSIYCPTDEEDASVSSENNSLLIDEQEEDEIVNPDFWIPPQVHTEAAEENQAVGDLLKEYLNHRTDVEKETDPVEGAGRKYREYEPFPSGAVFAVALIQYITNLSMDSMDVVLNLLRIPEFKQEDLPRNAKHLKHIIDHLPTINSTVVQNKSCKACMIDPREWYQRTILANSHLADQLRTYPYLVKVGDQRFYTTIRSGDRYAALHPTVRVVTEDGKFEFKVGDSVAFYRKVDESRPTVNGTGIISSLSFIGKVDETEEFNDKPHLNNRTFQCTIRPFHDDERGRLNISLKVDYSNFKKPLSFVKLMMSSSDGKPTVSDIVLNDMSEYHVSPLRILQFDVRNGMTVFVEKVKHYIELIENDFDGRNVQQKNASLGYSMCCPSSLKVCVDVSSINEISRLMRITYKELAKPLSVPLCMFRDSLEAHSFELSSIMGVQFWLPQLPQHSNRHRNLTCLAYAADVSHRKTKYQKVTDRSDEQELFCKYILSTLNKPVLMYNSKQG